MPMYDYAANTRPRGRGIWLCLALLSFAVFGAAWADQPQNNNPPSNDVDLTKAKGNLIAQGTNNRPAGPLNLKTYKVEKITLPKAMDVEVNGRPKRVDVVYRVTVDGGPFPVRALVTFMCVNGVSIPAIANADLTEVSGYAFDVSLLPNGATIAIGYGSPDASCGELDSYSELPEKLKIGESR